ncbi:PP2C family protein-serine/threonine phosphatase [Homoserinibacter sp. GY 40078]|uniref:PP2C family protein-serine/threonine phosphatase n=1 Tax=Homoserinibacter sp. GY 40078 TaxID=2603275 RepID=UPI0011C8290E|nr:PP2C family protein-serine/threonine phosphatase [Homoserinibacter sp. GY 40078]TXK17257.1 serine/threonine-protein phosphatase [Homoserinibacter sp. GY 40078]
MTATRTRLDRRGSEITEEIRADAAIDLLLSLAAHGPLPDPPAEATHAAQVIREALDELTSTQGALTEALVASQDRLLAVEALARINVQGVASAETLGLLLDKSLALTGASQVLFLEDMAVTMTRGATDQLDEHARIAVSTIAAQPDKLLRIVESSCAVVGTLDPDGDAERHVAFFRPSDSPFSTADIPLIQAIDSALGVLLAFNDLHDRELAQAAVEREHQLASVLAQSAIADEAPRSSAVDIFARTVPASLTGGDFYTFGRADGAIWFAVGDVAGKGLPAAMLMTRAVAACRVAFLANRGGGLVEVFAGIEDELFPHLDDAGVFITLTVGVIDESTRRLSLVNAGHSPVLLVHDDSAEPIPASVPPIGVVRHRVPRVSSFALDGRDYLLVGSDGLTEQCDRGDHQFGYERLAELCRESAGRTSRHIGETIFDHVDGFAAGHPASDDRTLVVIASTKGGS